MSLRSFLRLTAALSLAAFGSLAAHAYDSIVVFGDSYNDVGNVYYAASKYHVVYPPPPYFDGHFSNGPIWLEQIANDWNIVLGPSLKGGTDYAFGGAELLKSITDQGLPIPSVEEQVGLYLLQHGGKADPHALYVIEGGGNDILNAAPGTSPQVLGASIAAGLYGIEATLRAAGAKSFLIPDLLDVGLLPVSIQAGVPAIHFGNDASRAANAVLDPLLAADAKIPGIEIYRVPVFRTFLAVFSSKTHFGFTDVLNSCLDTYPICTTPSAHLWWDHFHPTKFGHAFFAVLVEGVVTNH